MTNYEMALELLNRGMADKHHTFNDTEYNEHIGYGVKRSVIKNRRGR